MYMQKKDEVTLVLFHCRNFLRIFHSGSCFIGRDSSRPYEVNSAKIGMTVQTLFIVTLENFYSHFCSFSFCQYRQCFDKRFKISNKTFEIMPVKVVWFIYLN